MVEAVPAARSNRDDTFSFETPNRPLVLEVNERIRAIGVAFSLAPERYELVCEYEACSCLGRIDVPRTVLDDVRATGIYNVVSAPAIAAAAG